MHKIAAWDNDENEIELKPPEKDFVAQIGAEMIFSILMLSSIDSNLLVLCGVHSTQGYTVYKRDVLQEKEEDNEKHLGNLIRKNPKLTDTH